jgi:hypothetical protein
MDDLEDDYEDGGGIVARVTVRSKVLPRLAFTAIATNSFLHISYSDTPTVLNSNPPP